nr:hypothetical protein [Tolivirales sp.]
MSKQNRPRRRPRNRGRQRGIVNYFTKEMLDYDRMVRDPCAANMAYPPYSGTDTGYLVRITEQIIPPAAVASGLTSGNTYPTNIYCQIVPKNFPAILIGSAGNANPSVAAVANNGIFLATGTVRSYRPVAACLKWVPTGPMLARQGVVGVGYSTSPPLFVSGLAIIGTLISQTLERVPNGGGPHEVRWLPTQDDEDFIGSNLAIATSPSSGTLFAVCNGVDGTAVSATSLQPDGFFEYTSVYEWIPGPTAGLTVAPKTPLPFTTQQHQSSIEELGDYLLKGVRTVSGNIGRGLVQGGIQTLFQAMGTTGSIRRYSSGFPMIGTS